MAIFRTKPLPREYSLDWPSKSAEVLDPLGFKLEGWVRETSENRLHRVEFWVDNRLAGTTGILFKRPDVAIVLRTDSLYQGFSIFVRATWVLGSKCSACKLVAVLESGVKVLASLEMHWVERDYRKMDYGSLLDQDNSILHHRDNIYSSGPSVHDPSPECLQLVERYLGPPPMTILDVGCGIGAYGRPLLSRGYDWMGVEVKTSDCVELEKRGMPHRHTDGRCLPFGDGSFDSAISIEVLEHIEEPDAFLREIRRVTRRRVVISVPNIEILPYMRPLLATPWHILEADHKNFFTRMSLKRLLSSAGFERVEVIPYGIHPLKSAEGFPLYYHLLAISDI